MKNSSKVAFAGLVFTIDFFLTVLILKVVRNFQVLQLFEQILFSCIAASILLGLAIWVFSLKYSLFKGLLSYSAWTLLVSALIMMITGPNIVLNIDRSRSFYVLSWIDEGKVQLGKNGVRLDAINSPEKQNVDSIRERIEEHTARGLVGLNNNKYFLTERGKFTLLIANKVATFYNLEAWFRNRF